MVNATVKMHLKRWVETDSKHVELDVWEDDENFIGTLIRKNGYIEIGFAQERFCDYRNFICELRDTLEGWGHKTSSTYLPQGGCKND